MKKVMPKPALQPSDSCKIHQMNSTNSAIYIRAINQVDLNLFAVLERSIAKGKACRPLTEPYPIRHQPCPEKAPGSAQEPALRSPRSRNGPTPFTFSMSDQARQVLQTVEVEVMRTHQDYCPGVSFGSDTGTS